MHNIRKHTAVAAGLLTLGMFYTTSAHAMNCADEMRQAEQFFSGAGNMPAPSESKESMAAHRAQFQRECPKEAMEIEKKVQNMLMNTKITIRQKNPPQ